ncbi:MAG: PAC2 family protein [Ilumatobacteraceae bacterium]
MEPDVEHLRWHRPPALKNPVVLAAVPGGHAAGAPATPALKTLIETSGAEPLAEIDPEPFTDFATVRPLLRLDENGSRNIIWPTVGVWSASLPGTDVVMVLGPEPALRWRTFTEQITAVAQRVGAPMVITLGALLADVPHTRPVHVIGTASDDTLMERYDLERSRYEGPTGIVGVIQDSLSRAGFPGASLWAAVPGYASQIPSPKAALALVERVCEMMGPPAPTADLADAAAASDARVEALINDDDDLVIHIEQLEEIVDEMDEDEDTSGPIDLDESIHLLDEVEQFLRDHDGDS